MITRGSLNACMLVALSIVAVMANGCGYTCTSGRTDSPNRFEAARAYVQAWLSGASADSLLVSALWLKGTIVDDWEQRRDGYEIVSVRKPDDYNRAGHIPHASNIYWVDIVNDSAFDRLDSNKTMILYCYFGHASMLSATILNLLGYRCRSLAFGIMGWNLDALVKEPWDQKADYDVELTRNESKGSYPLPVITSRQYDGRAIIKEMARKYLAGEGSPVILSSDVKSIVDDWGHKEAEYQVVDVRSREAYEAGHVPHSLHIPWAQIADVRHLKALNPRRTTIVYSENGQTGQLAATVLNLFGYRAVAMKFGMMDWNSGHVEKADLWHGAAGYPVEVSEESR